MLLLVGYTSRHVHRVVRGMNVIVAVCCSGRQVYLDITVKVMQKWRTSEKVLEEYGY